MIITSRKQQKKIKWKEINCKPEKCVFMCVLYKYKYVKHPPNTPLIFTSFHNENILFWPKKLYFSVRNRTVLQGWVGTDHRPTTPAADHIVENSLKTKTFSSPFLPYILSAFFAISERFFHFYIFFRKKYI